MERRELGSAASKVIWFVCACLSILFLYQAYNASLNLIHMAAAFIMPTTVLTFLYFPPLKGHGVCWGWVFKIDCAMATLGGVAIGYLAWVQPQMMVVKWAAETPEYIATTIVIILLLEAARRTVGIFIPMLTIFSLLYAHFGSVVPGLLGHPGFSWAYIVEYAGLSADGIWGVPARVMAGIVVIFIIFSSFLRVGGVSGFFVDLPLSLFGKYRGGPAKAAVLASGFFGTISGSVIANVATTGTFTIPLMKKIGYRPHIAGAVEAVASTGGQLMPPVMGAAAFIMAEIIGIDYWSICVAAFLPGILYFLSLFVVLDTKAHKEGIRGLSEAEVPSLKKTLFWGWPLLLPLIVLVFFLGVLRWDAASSCFFALISLLLCSLPNKDSRMGPRRIYEALHQAWPALIPLGSLAGCIGVFIGCINITGVGLSISMFMIEITHGILPLLALLTMAVSILLGMSMPTTACYLFLAPLLAPALSNLGVPLLAAHLFIFYGGILSAVTPPNCIGAFTAAPICGEPLMKVGWASARLATIAYVIPFIWIFDPLLIMQGAAVKVALVMLTAVIGVISWALALEGRIFKDANVWQRLLLFIGGVVLIIPSWQTDLIGLGMITLGAIWNYVLNDGSASFSS